MKNYPQENIGANEPAILADIVSGTIADQNRDYKPGTVAKRDVHTKSHGTFTDARIRILDRALAGPLGLFGMTGQSFRATVRLSNGAPGTGADWFPNVRGIAIKVHGVNGEKLLAGDEGADCCDFLLANHPVSFHKHLEEYPDIRALMSSGRTGEVFKKYPAEGKLLKKAVLKLVKNPLTIDYFSQTPYMFGPARAVKYALIPSQRSWFFSIPNLFDSAYLRHAAERFLRKQSAEFTLCVQLQGENDPIEDPSVEWIGRLIPVAVLTIPQRKGDEPLTESGGEALSFNPWRTLREHRPLGWVNRVREAVYRADFEWRSAKNAALKQDPSAS